jgi:hypothetical protein
MRAMEFLGNARAGTQKGPTFVDPFDVIMAFCTTVQ